MNAEKKMKEAKEALAKLNLEYFDVHFYRKNELVDSSVESIRASNKRDFRGIQKRTKENLEYLAEKTGGLTTFTGLHAIAFDERKNIKFVIIYRPTFQYTFLTSPEKIRDELKLLGNY